MILQQNRFCQIFGKVVLGILLVFMVGLPIVHTWKMLVFLGGILALIYSDIILEKRRVIWGIGIVASMLTIKAFLPAAGIEEGHNIFLVFEPDTALKAEAVKDNKDIYGNLIPSKEHDEMLLLAQGKGTLQQSIPVQIYNDWRREFNRLYPSKEPPYPKEIWQHAISAGNMPDRAYAWSADAFWRPAKYSRKVDHIDFNSLAEFRGGFANDRKYDWWKGDLSRRAMPFFVMYEFSERSTGCELFWKGPLFWEKTDGSFEKINHPALTGKTITRADAGKRVYILFMPQFTPVFPVYLKLNTTLAASRTIGSILTAVGILAIFMLPARFRWRPFLNAAALVAIAMVLIYASIAFSGGKPLGANYACQGGGDDGIYHESLGHYIAEAFRQGHVAEALAGYEPVYGGTPGMRYFRALEKIIFGDTNLGLTAFIACMPLWVFLLIRRLCGAKWAYSGVFVFLFSPMSFSFAQYIVCGLLGYGEPVGSGLFILGAFLLLKSQPRQSGDDGSPEDFSAWTAFLGGAFLAGSFFIRPNYAIAAVLLGGFYMYAGLRDGRFRLIFPVMVGLGLASFMTWHNWYFGHEFFLINGSVGDALPISPMTYIQAFREWTAGLIHRTGYGQAPHLKQAMQQIENWLWTPPIQQFPLHKGVSLLLLLRLFTLLATFYALFISPKRFPCFALLAWVALAAHIPMLLVFDTKFRYALLGWDLSMIVTIMLAAYIMRHRSLPPLWYGRTNAALTEPQGR